MDPHVQEKVLSFEAYVDNVLKSDLAQLAKKIDAKNTDLAEFIQLKLLITTFQNRNMTKTGFKTQVDIGSNFFIEAHVPDASKIFLDVGLGHYIEFTLEEALIVINVRTKLLEQQIAHLRKAVAKTNAYIKLILLTIRDIQGIKEMFDSEDCCKQKSS